MEVSVCQPRSKSKTLLLTTVLFYLSFLNSSWTDVKVCLWATCFKKNTWALQLPAWYPTTQMCAVTRPPGYLACMNTDIWTCGKWMLKQAFQILSECLAPCKPKEGHFPENRTQRSETKNKAKLLDKKYIVLNHYPWKNKLFFQAIAFQSQCCPNDTLWKEFIGTRSNWGSDQVRRKMLWMKWILDQSRLFPIHGHNRTWTLLWMLKFLTQLLQIKIKIPFWTPLHLDYLSFSINLGRSGCRSFP